MWKDLYYADKKNKKKEPSHYDSHYEEEKEEYPVKDTREKLVFSEESVLCSEIKKQTSYTDRIPIFLGEDFYFQRDFTLDQLYCAGNMVIVKGRYRRRHPNQDRYDRYVTQDFEYVYREIEKVFSSALNDALAILRRKYQNYDGYWELRCDLEGVMR